MKTKLLFVFILLIAVSIFSQKYDVEEKYEAEWVVDGRVFEWAYPITSRSWIRKAYRKVNLGREGDWREITNCKWKPTSIKLTGYVLLGYKIKIVLIRPENMIRLKKP